MGLPAVEEKMMATPKLKSKGGKGITTKHASTLKLTGYDQLSDPEVKIIKCIGFQKFRYFGENRPGKKYQDKDFLTLALCNMSGKNVRVQIVCFDAEHQNEIHPNGLVGRDCEEGIYTKLFPISKATQIVRIPYLRTERILTKKTQKDGDSKLRTKFEERAKILPAPYSQQCLLQVVSGGRKYDTTRVCFGIIVTIEGANLEPLFVMSNVVQNASEKTTLSILKLSTSYVSAQEGGEVDIFTSEDGPPITTGKCTVKVVVPDVWQSEETTPTQEDILYKRVVTYQLPAFLYNRATDHSVRAEIHLYCKQSGQGCFFDFFYEPGADSNKRLATLHSNIPLRKRPYIPDPTDDFNMNGVDNIKVSLAPSSNDEVKMRVKEKLKSRKAQENVMSYDAVSLAGLPPGSVTMNSSSSNAFAPSPSSAAAGVVAEDGLPLHQQDDIVLAKDMVTGEVVYIRTQQQQNPSQDIVMYVQDAQTVLTSNGALSSSGLTLLADAPRATPVSEWSDAMASAQSQLASIRSMDTSSTSIMSDQAQHHTPRPVAVARRRSNKFVSPWLVDENPPVKTESSDTSMYSASPSPSSSSSSSAAHHHHHNHRGAAAEGGVLMMKQEPREMGPPILHKRLMVSSDGGVAGLGSSSAFLPSGGGGTLISASALNSGNLPSLNSLFANGVLEGVRFDETGNLLSSSVFEMVHPYINDKL